MDWEKWVEEHAPAVDPDAGAKAHLKNSGIPWEFIPEAHELLYDQRVPGVNTLHTQGMLSWGKMNVWDQETFRKAMEMPFAGKDLRWIASIPVGIAGMMWEAGSPVFSDPKELKKWLRDNSPKGGAKYKVPGAKL